MASLYIALRGRLVGTLGYVESGYWLWLWECAGPDYSCTVPGFFTSAKCMDDWVKKYWIQDALLPGLLFEVHWDNTTLIAYYDSIYYLLSNGTWTFTKTIIAINKPTNLTAISPSCSQISLTWTDNSNNETGFKIERRSETETAFSEIATVSANTTTYTDTGLQADTTYYYRVRAYDANGNSDYSNEASVKTSVCATYCHLSVSGSPARYCDGSLNFSGTSDPTKGLSVKWYGTKNGIADANGEDYGTPTDFNFTDRGWAKDAIGKYTRYFKAFNAKGTEVCKSQETVNAEITDCPKYKCSGTSCVRIPRALTRLPVAITSVLLPRHTPFPAMSETKTVRQSAELYIRCHMELSYRSRASLHRRFRFKRLLFAHYS